MSFRGKFVDYYEIFFADKKFDDLSIKVIELCKKYINDFEYILDFGCGTGVFDIRFAKEGYSVYGVDISRDMIKYAKEHNFLNNKIKYINGDIRNIKIDKIFDVVCALSHVICYQVSNESLMGVFMNAYKHLRRGGIFIFFVFYRAAIMKNGFESRIKKVENKGVRITRFSNIKNYSIESAYTEANSIIRTRMYVLEKLKIDKKMLLEFLLGDKEKYLKNIFNGAQKNDEFNLNEFYEKNKFALQDINRESIYYRKNAILPMYILQEKIVTENILEKEYSQLDLIKKRFNYERINKINADELDDFINIMQDTDRVKDNLAEFIATELDGLTDMEKRMSADNIIENVLVICKYKKINNDIAKQTLEIIQYLINDLERNVKIERNNELLQKIGDLSNKIDIEDKQIEDELKDSLSYLKIKLEMANGGSLTPDIFFNRLQSSLKNGSKIERNEELIAYQTIKDELNISKK